MTKASCVVQRDLPKVQSNQAARPSDVLLTLSGDDASCVVTAGPEANFNAICILRRATGPAPSAVPSASCAVTAGPAPGTLMFSYRYLVISKNLPSVRKVKILFILFIQRAARCSLNLCPDGFFSSTQCGFSLTEVRLFPKGVFPFCKNGFSWLEGSPGSLLTRAY